MRTRFDEQLRQLNVELIRMGSLCEEAISIAAKALEGNEKVDAGRVFSLENDIDQMEHDIESRCMRMLLQQQPVATDLRVISAALKMISDMERIGDQAADIAEMVDYVKDTVAQGKVHITNMARAAVSMVTESVEAFVQADMKLAQVRFARALRSLNARKAEFPDLSPEALTAAYPGRCQSLTQVLSTTDARLSELNRM